MISRGCVKTLHEQRGSRPFGRNRVERGSKPTQENARREKQVRRREAGQMEQD